MRQAKLHEDAVIGHVLVVRGVVVRAQHAAEDLAE